MNSIIDTIKAVIANLLPRRLHEALEHLEPVSEDSSAEFLNEQEQAVKEHHQRRQDTTTSCDACPAVTHLQQRQQCFENR
jgi:hypothetical protein